MTPTPPDRSRLTFRSGYCGDAVARGALKDLLRATFGLDLDGYDRLGFWDRHYTPYSYFAGDRLVANVSAFPMPVVVGGRPVAATGLQSGAVVPGYRGLGLYRSLIEKALADADRRGPLAFLTAAAPEIYARFGFRPVAEHGFVGPPPATARAGPSSRRLSLDDPGDAALVRELLRGRSPVSLRFGLVDHASPFLLHLLLHRRLELHLLPELELITVTERLPGGRLRLGDLVGRRIPPLPAILAALGAAPEVLELSFPPDRFEWPSRPEPVQEPHSLMVRGDFAPGGPGGIPPTAAF